MNRVLIPDTKISILRCPDDAKNPPGKGSRITGNFSLCLRGYIVQSTTGQLPGQPDRFSNPDGFVISRDLKRTRQRSRVEARQVRP
jgi:hypothetical protein